MSQDQTELAPIEADAALAEDDTGAEGVVTDIAASGKQSPIALHEGGRQEAILNEEIEILYTERRPQFDKGPVKAYAAKPRGKSAGQPYFAMICEKHLTPRPRVAPSYAAIINTGLAKLIASGIVYWPPEKKWRYCFVYEDTLGQPLMKSLAEPGLGLRPEKAMVSVIKPMINVLLDLKDRDIIHGDIRPTNMFDCGDKNLERVALGECLSTPTGYTQPAVFLSVERAMCDPIARGKGFFEDDLYAFGVSLVMLMRKKDPMAKFTPEQIMREKIDHGSYVALTGNERFTGAVLELLRGLLYDDPYQRWGMEEVAAWVDGQRLSPKQSSKRKKAARPIIFNEEKYFLQSELAYDLNKDQAEAARIIEGGSLEQWITRSLEDSSIHERFEQAVETTQEFGHGPGYWDRLIARVSIALDPRAPIRYKGLSMNPEGIATALTEAVALKQDLQPYVDIINQQLVHFWLTNQTDLNVDVGALASRYDGCRSFLRQINMGYGIERCLYSLNPEAPCLSDRLADYYVRTPEDLMYALEDMADRKNRPELFIDRHIAAFLSVKDRKSIDAYWSELNAEEYPRRIMGNIKVLATIQQRGRMEMFPGLSRWVGDIIEPLYGRYHDRELRDKFRKKMEKLKDAGDIVKIAGIFDNKETLKKDQANFKAAMREYYELRVEKAKLQNKLENPDIFGRETGREIAAIVSCVLGGIVVLAFCFLFFLNKGIF